MKGIRSLLDSRFTFRLVQVGVVLSLVLGLVVSAKVYAFTDCLSRYQDQSARAGNARADAYERASNAEDDLWLAVYDAQKLPPDEARRLSTEAFDKYVTERRAARQERVTHPLPAPPSQVCR